MVQAGKIVVLREIRGDFPIGHHLVAEVGVYVPYLNRHGAVSVKINDEFLGLKPNEFEWLEKPSCEGGIRVSKEMAMARQQFLEAVKAVNEGKVDKNAPIPGRTGEIHGQSSHS